MSRGGKREGAGRPRIDPELLKIPVGYKLPRWLVEWLREQDDSAAVIIESALSDKHNIGPSVEKLAVGTDLKNDDKDE